MALPRWSACGPFTRLLLTSVLLGACASSPHRSGLAPRGDLRFDTESVARARYAGLARGTAGTTTASSTTAWAVGATTLVLATPLVMAVLDHDEDKARELQLARLWPAPFSLEQRYRYYPKSQFLETISRAEEQQLIAQGCANKLWRTIKPDIILHADHHLLQAVLILDFKFPCPPTNPPTWKQYGGTSAYAHSTQGQVYEQALGGKALLLSPQGVPP